MPIFESSGCNGNVRALEQRDFLVRWGQRLGIVVVLAALSFGGYCGYGAWRTQHLEKQVQQFVSAGEYQSAVLVARRLLDLNADNLTAARAMAEMAERAGRVDAVQWRKRIAHLEPNVPANQLALIKAALGFGQTDLAQHPRHRRRTGAAFGRLPPARSRGRADAAGSHEGGGGIPRGA